MKNKWGLINKSWPFLAILLGLAVWSRYFIVQYDPARGLNTGDSIYTLDLAQIGREVSRGRGLATRFIRPVALRFNSDFRHFPEITYPPLYPLLLGLAMKYLGARDLTLVLVSAFFFWAVVPLLWSLSVKFAGRGAASLVLLLYLINPISLRYSINGGPVTFSAFLSLLFLLFLFRSERGTVFWLPAAGLVAGLAYLTRYGYGLWIIPGGLLFCLDQRPGRGRRIGLFLAGFVLPLIPWLIRNWVVAGNPFFTLQGFKPLMFTAGAPGHLLWRGFSSDSLQVPRRIFFITRKFLVNFRDSYLDILLLTGNFAGVFTIAAVFHRFRHRSLDRLKYCLYLMVILEAASFSLFRPSWNGRAALLPGALLIAGIFLADLLAERSRRARVTLLCFFLLLCLVPISGKFSGRQLAPRGFYNLDNIREVCRCRRGAREKFRRARRRRWWHFDHLRPPHRPRFLHPRPLNREGRLSCPRFLRQASRGTVCTAHRPGVPGRDQGHRRGSASRWN
jgi:4-amino-4-deoxy-L-arabinose transferase-like glycosyltransferase